MVGGADGSQGPKQEKKCDKCQFFFYQTQQGPQETNTCLDCSREKDPARAKEADRMCAKSMFAVLGISEDNLLGVEEFKTLLRQGHIQNHTSVWVNTVLGHIENEEARKRISDFLQTEPARKVVSEWVLKKTKPEVFLTDVNDVYKLSQAEPFRRVQVAKKFEVTFSLIVRDASEMTLERLFKDAQPGTSFATIRDDWLKDIFSLKDRKIDKKVLEEAEKHLVKPLAGVIKLEKDTQKEIEDLTSKEVRIQVFLKEKNTKKEEWLEIEGPPGGPWLAKKQSGGDSGMQIQEACTKWKEKDFSLVVYASGPWHLVTFFETPMMQVTARAMARGMQLRRGWSDAKYFAMGLQQMDQRLEALEEELKKDHEAQVSKGSFEVYLFSGRRTPHLGFHLLQNLWCAMKGDKINFKGTSSLLAFRVFRDWLNKAMEKDTSTQSFTTKMKEITEKLQLVGTHAHEGSMVFQALACEEDDLWQYPVSSLLWHMNYWLLTGSQAVLPDTLGSNAFMHLMKNLKFPETFVGKWNELHSNRAGKEFKVEPDKFIADLLQDPKFGGFIRQDSGDMQPFSKTVFQPAIKSDLSDGGVLKWLHGNSESPGYKCLASEISSPEDIEKARKLGYCGMGAGGYFGEKPWAEKGADRSIGSSKEQLTGKLDLVAKVGSVKLDGGDGAKFHPVKLGDNEKAGEWHSAKPVKFAMSPEVQNAGAGPDIETQVFNRFKRLGEVLEGDLANVANYAEGEKMKKKFDELTPDDRQTQFAEFWQKHNYVFPLPPATKDGL